MKEKVDWVFCEMCQSDELDILNHLRLFHPDHYGDGPQLWPDGSFVIEEEDL